MLNGSISPFRKAALLLRGHQTFALSAKFVKRNLGRNVKTVAGSLAVCKRSIFMLRYIKAYSAAAFKAAAIKVSDALGHSEQTSSGALLPWATFSSRAP